MNVGHRRSRDGTLTHPFHELRRFIGHAPAIFSVYNGAMLVPSSPLILTTVALRAGPLDFSDPSWLWALLIFFPIVYLWKTSRVPATAIRRWVTLLLRSALVLALTFSLAGTRLVWFNKGICVVFVLDQSQSVPGAARDVVRERMANEVQKMTKDDRFVVVEFGGDAVLGSLPSAERSDAATRESG